MDVYAENILEHFRHPRGKKPLHAATVTHEEVNWSCGDTLTLSLSLQDGALTGIGWDGTGCAISQAAMSMLSEELPGKTEEDMHALSVRNIYDLLGVPIGPRRMKCALLGLHALRNALRKAEGKEPLPWAETIGEIDSGQWKIDNDAGKRA